MKEHMTSILTFLLTTLLLGCTTNQHKNYGDSIKGRIKFITQFGYEAAEGHGNTLIDKLTTKTTFRYDEKGNLLETNYYDIKTDVVFSKDKRSYDVNSNLLEITFYNKAGEIEGKYHYKYDERNNEIEKITYWKGTYDGKVITTYDYKSMLVNVNTYKADGSYVVKFSYKIDDKKNHLEDYNSNGELESKSIFEYDKMGHVSKELSESWDEDTTKAIISYQYDEWDNVVNRMVTDLKGNKTIISNTKTEYDYDKLGNWIRSVKTYSYNDIRETAKREMEYY